jgi:hypothetical protein
MILFSIPLKIIGYLVTLSLEVCTQPYIYRLKICSIQGSMYTKKAKFSQKLLWIHELLYKHLYLKSALYGTSLHIF